MVRCSFVGQHHVETEQRVLLRSPRAAAVPLLLRELLSPSLAQWPFWTAFVASLVLMFALSFSDSLRRQHPTNLIMLGLFTLCEAFLVRAGTHAVLCCAATNYAGRASCSYRS